MKGKKYVVVQQEILEDLQKNVTDLLDQGYELAGGVSVVAWKSGGKEGEKTRWMHSQALVSR
jgi:hypothetical protein